MAMKAGVIVHYSRQGTALRGSFIFALAFVGTNCFVHFGRNWTRNATNASAHGGGFGSEMKRKRLIIPGELIRGMLAAGEYDAIKYRVIQDPVPPDAEDIHAEVDSGNECYDRWMLDPCPFCKGKIVFFIGGLSSSGTFSCGPASETGRTSNRTWAACRTCFAEGPVADTRREAAEKWNIAEGSVPIDGRKRAGKTGRIMNR